MRVIRNSKFSTQTKDFNKFITSRNRALQRPLPQTKGKSQNLKHREILTFFYGYHNITCFVVDTITPTDGLSFKEFKGQIEHFVIVKP